MKQQPTIMISLPVSDLSKSIAFYKAIGFSQGESCAGEDSAHMILSDSVSVMLLPHLIWEKLTSRAIPDAKKMAQVGFSLYLENKGAVDAFVDSGVSAGGTADPNPIEDYDCMYGRGLEDPDGHIWEAKWLNVATTPKE